MTRKPKENEKLNDKELLEELYLHQKLSLREIAKICKCGIKTFHIYRKKHGIPTRPSKHPEVKPKPCLACKEIMNPPENIWPVMWERKNTCSNICRTALAKQTENERRPRLIDNLDEAKGQFFMLREKLGFQEYTSESTFDPYDLMEISRRTEDNTLYKDNRKAFYEFFLYFRRFNRDDNLYQAHNSLPYLYNIHKIVFPEEFSSLPLWAAPYNRRKRITSETWLDEDDCINYKWLYQVFDRLIYRLEEIYQTPLKDISLFYTKGFFAMLKQKHMWEFPYPEFFHEGTVETNHRMIFNGINSYWDFLRMFQHHTFRDNGKFTKLKNSKVEFLTHTKSSLLGTKTNWTLSLCREWFFDIFCKEWKIEIDRNTFPYTASDDELNQVIEVHIHMLLNTEGYVRMLRSLTKGKHKAWGICRLVQTLWPDYDMDVIRWSRMLVSEKRMARMLQYVWAYKEWDMFSTGGTSPILTRTGKEAKYRKTGKNMRVDIIDYIRLVIFEGQGGQHYYEIDWSLIEGVAEIVEEGGTVYSDNLPSIQYRDRLKKRAGKRHGYRVFYIPFTKRTVPVKGVHGDLPVWDRTYEGLARLLDMQNGQDIAEAIREYDAYLEEE